MATITSFAPLTASPGTKISIYGTGFTGATDVEFGGYDALIFKVVTDLLIEAYTGLDGDGTVSVTTASGTVTRAGFTQLKTKKKIPQFPYANRPLANADKVLIWGDAEGRTLYGNIGDLPFTNGSGGGGTGTALGSPFPVRVSDISYSYNAGTNTTTITDVRLIGKTDYAVIATQLGGNEFPDNLITYNALAGSVTIAAFQLDADAKLRIYADGVVGSGLLAFMASMQAQLTLMAQYMAPFKVTALGPNGGKVWFTGNIATLAGTGWQECIAMRGKFPMGVNPNDADPLFSVVGATGGSKSHVIASVNNLPSHSFFTVVNDGITTNSFPDQIGRALTALRSMITSWSKPNSGGKESYVLYGAAADGIAPTLSPTNIIGKDTPDAIVNMNPYLVGTWIEFIGL